MRLVVTLALAVIVGLVAGDIIGIILGAGPYRGSLPGVVVVVGLFMWRRRQEGRSLKALKTTRPPAEARAPDSGPAPFQAPTAAASKRSA
jgi:uncharacterized membrane protein YfcA